MIDLKFDEQRRIIDMELFINHFKDNIPFADLDTNLSLVLDNTKQYPIDLEGNTIGDYDYFYMQAEAGVPLKSLVESGIAAVDSDGTINSKCNYKS